MNKQSCSSWVTIPNILQSKQAFLLAPSLSLSLSTLSSHHSPRVLYSHTILPITSILCIFKLNDVLVTNNQTRKCNDWNGVGMSILRKRCMTYFPVLLYPLYSIKLLTLSLLHMWLSLLMHMSYRTFRKSFDAKPLLLLCPFYRIVAVVVIRYHYHFSSKLYSECCLCALFIWIGNENEIKMSSEFDRS